MLIYEIWDNDSHKVIYKTSEEIITEDHSANIIISCKFVKKKILDRYKKDFNWQELAFKHNDISDDNHYAGVF